MTSLTTTYSRVTKPARWAGGPAAVTIICNRRAGLDFEPGVEVVLEERPLHADGSVGDWRRVRSFRQDFAGPVPLAVGEIRFHLSQSDDHARVWSIDVRDDYRQAVDLRFDEAGLDPVA